VGLCSSLIVGERMIMNVAVIRIRVVNARLEWGEDVIGNVNGELNILN